MLEDGIKIFALICGYYIVYQAVLSETALIYNAFSIQIYAWRCNNNICNDALFSLELLLHEMLGSVLM